MILSLTRRKLMIGSFHACQRVFNCFFPFFCWINNFRAEQKIFDLKMNVDICRHRQYSKNSFQRRCDIVRRKIEIHLKWLIHAVHHFEFIRLETANVIFELCEKWLQESAKEISWVSHKLSISRVSQSTAKQKNMFELRNARAITLTEKFEAEWVTQEAQSRIWIRHRAINHSEYQIFVHTNYSHRRCTAECTWMVATI